MRGSIGLTFTFFLLSGCSFLLNSPPTNGAISSFTLSAAYGTQYAISVWVPPGIAASDRVPTLYILDGDETFNNTARLASREGETLGLRFIVVAIGYGEGENMRTRDYTPTTVEGEGGGCAAFLDFVTQQLIPRIESDYPAVTDRSGRAISGHSFGGLVVLQALFTKTGVFSGFIATSPSLWWNGNVMFDNLSAFLAATGSLQVSRLYVSTGSHEGEGMEILSEELDSRLEDAAVPALSLRYEVIPNKRHWDVRYDALSSAIPFVIGREL